jgi:hypothetical protein
MSDDDRDLRVRRRRFVRVPGAALADRTAPLSGQPPDVGWSDCGPWPSTSDDPGPRRPCARCGRLGTQSLLATGGLCWTCAAQEYRRRLEAEA